MTHFHFTHSRTTTPSANNMINLLGGKRYKDVTLTHDEVKRLQRLYQYEKELPGTLQEAGSERNMFRHAESDGLRLVAWLAKYLKPGQDPLKMLVQLVAESGCDVSPEDYEWADKLDEDGVED